MKIIAMTAGGYILEANAEELDNLMGYANYYDRMKDRASQYTDRRELPIGGIIPIGKMFDRLYRMTNMARELTEISAKLKAASDFVNTALPTIGRVNEAKE